MLQWGRQSYSGNVGGGNYVEKSVTLNMSYTAYYTKMAMHYDGNQMNVTGDTARSSLSTMGLLIRNVNAQTKADLQGVYWITIGY